MDMRISDPGNLPPPSPQALMLKSLGGMIFPLALKCALELGVFRAIGDGISSAQALAGHLEADPAALRRLLNALVSMGLLQGGEGVHQDEYIPSDLGATLLPGASPYSLEALALYLLDDSMLLPMMQLSQSVRTGKPSLKQDEQSGWYDEYPQRALLMDRAMLVYSSISLPSLLAAYDFSRHRLIMDIAGGIGQMVVGILKNNPGVRGALFDIPETAKRAGAYLQAQALTTRCEVLPGDMFESIPGGADLYLLSKVLNNWDERHAARILRNIATAMSASATLLIVESLATAGVPTHEDAFRDLMLLACSNGGRVRAESALRSLIAEAGLEWIRIIPTGSAFPLIECRRRQ
ncbi:hypothetical protein AAKU55_001031 [Oxalobacteraceae bacterium GrIS 1.11]